jgi:hypothetical protein
MIVRRRSGRPITTVCGQAGKDKKLRHLNDTVELSPIFTGQI